MTVSWNVTAVEVDVETKTKAQVVRDAGYYDIYNVVGVDEIAVSAIHHKQLIEFANVGASIRNYSNCADAHGYGGHVGTCGGCQGSVLTWQI